MNSYAIVEDIIILEFALVIVIIIMAALSKLINTLNDRKNNRISFELHQYLELLVVLKRKFIYKEFKNRWKKLDVLLFCIEQFDNTYTSDNWIEARRNIIEEIVLPLAKKSTYKNDIHHQVSAARAFGLMSNTALDLYLLHLIESNIPLVFNYTLSAALSNHAEQTIEKAIQKMSHESWASKEIFLKEFDSLSVDQKKYFQNKLLNTNDPRLRTIYYRILFRFSATPIDWDISQDIFSSYNELQMAAIKYITRNDRDNAIPLLIKVLEDDDWNVRLVAINRLAYLHAKKAIPEITKHLKDSDWWVRLSAKEALDELKLPTR